MAFLPFDVTRKDSSSTSSARTGHVFFSSWIRVFVRTPYSDRRIHLITCRTRIAIALFVTIATLLLCFGLIRGFASSFATKLSLLLALPAGEDRHVLIVFLLGVLWLGGGCPGWPLTLLTAVLFWRFLG